MIDTTISPVFWSVEELVSFGDDAIYDLALCAAGTKTSNNLLLGRCLLAVEQTGLDKRLGRSGAIHFATSVLGMSEKEAGTVRRVARLLQELPLLTQAAEHGTIAWSKLREVASVASAQTEELWLELCGKMGWTQIQKLVKLTPKGGIPGTCPDGPAGPHGDEYRCRFSPEVVTVIERVLRQRARIQGQPLSFAEAVEQLFSEALAGKPFDEAADKLREEARQELWAEQLAREPLVHQARELAEELGLLESDQLDFDELDSLAHDGSLECDGLPRATESSHTGQSLAESSHTGQSLAESSHTGQSLAESSHTRQSLAESSHAGQSLAESSHPGQNLAESSHAGQSLAESSRAGQNLAESSRTGQNLAESSHAGRDLGDAPVPSTCCTGSSCAGGRDVVEASRETTEGGAEHDATSTCSQARDLGHTGHEEPLLQRLLSHLHFHPEQRHLTTAQRKALLRRDRYCCQTPGCPHRLWLHIHHVKWYCLDGKTLPENLVTLCTRCHRNVHEGRLRITRSASGELLFTDQRGQRLDIMHRIERAAWLDYNVGWRGDRLDSYQSRLLRAIGLPPEAESPILLSAS